MLGRGRPGTRLREHSGKSAAPFVKRNAIQIVSLLVFFGGYVAIMLRLIDPEFMPALRTRGVARLETGKGDQMNGGMCAGGDCQPPPSPTVPLTLLSSKCSIQDFLRTSYDPLERYVQIPPDRLAKALWRNPFKCDHGGTLKAVTSVSVPSWYFSKTRSSFVFGGLTADMGWVLMVARHTMTRHWPKQHALQFFSEWGHGCPLPDGVPNMGWTCFFKQVTPSNCLPGTKSSATSNSANFTLYESKYDQIRHDVKLYDIYSNESKNASAVRNMAIIKNAGLEDLVPFDNDLQAMRILFHWVYQLQDHTRAMVDKAKAPLVGFSKGQPYIAFHIRWGDKIGRGGGPQESVFVPLERYIESVHCYYSHYGKSETPRYVYIATDDYAAVEKLRRLLGNEFVVGTSAQPSNSGFSIQKYHSGEMGDQAKFNESVRLWADMEILAGAEVFVGNMESNIGKTVHLMRMGRHPHTSMNAVSIHHTECCYDSIMNFSKRRFNCFWQCA
mmetsp:Transcript_19890/g.56870  ORF Transcript_19890/g.56870 Transcript_19890/m.56870 type:complete len:499 (-) Transcript_19890:476-1972(-)